MFIQLLLRDFYLTNNTLIVLDFNAVQSTRLLHEIEENEQKFTNSLREQLEKVLFFFTFNGFLKTKAFTKITQVRKDKAVLEAELSSRTKAFETTLGQLQNMSK